MGKGGHSGRGRSGGHSSGGSRSYGSSSSYGSRSYSRSSGSRSYSSGGGGECDSECMKVLAFISFFVFSIVWLIITLCAGNENATVLDPGENRVLDTSSSYFATGVSIVDDSRSIDVYYLDTKPTLGDSGSQSPILFDKTIDMGNEEYIFYAFYLNQGSTIDVSVTAQGNSGVDFYVCTSQDQCDTLIDAVEDGSYVYTYKKYFKSASGEKKKLAYGVQNDGMHYLVLNNVLARGVAVHISYEIHRTLYNLPDNATPVCAAKKEGEKTSYFEELCVINFDKSDGAVLMVAPPVKESDSDSDSGSGSGSASDSGKASSDQKDSLTESYEVQYNVLSSNWSWFLVWAACGLMTLLLILMPCSASECSSMFGSCPGVGNTSSGSSATYTQLAEAHPVATVEAQPFKPGDVQMALVSADNSMPMSVSLTPSAPPKEV